MINTKISFYLCNFFDKETLQEILKKEKLTKARPPFNIVLLSKTLHHLRTGECIANKRKKHGQKHKHREDEKCCIYKFEKHEIFKCLSKLGERVVVYECFYPHEKDKDKVRGRGGHFTTEEWRDLFYHLLARNDATKCEVKFIRPRKGDLHKALRNDKEEELLLGEEKEETRLDKVLRQVDCICFYIEHANKVEKKKEM